MPLAFALTFDYLCPFARNGSEFVLAGLAADADWQVTFTPYSLTAGNAAANGRPPVWADPEPNRRSGVLALQAGLAVRDLDPAQFPDAHRELFAARHDRGEDIRDPAVVAKALEVAGVDAPAMLAEVATGRFLDVLRTEHDRNVADHGVWGVPTFITESRAVFIRVMDRPTDGAAAIQRVERLLELITGFGDLNEFKQVDIPA